jgi:hypothetical protein
MIRSNYVALVCAAALTATARMAQAQAPTPSPEGQRFYAEAAAAATLGNKSDKAFDVEFGYRLTNAFTVFVEGGHMGNVATADLDARAQRIATFIKGTSGAVQKANFFDIGVTYRLPPLKWNLQPYVGFGVGAAKVSNEVSFVVNGSDVTSQLLDTYGVELGNDLADSLTKPFFTIPIGVRYTVLKRYFIDGSYRYGRIAARTSQIDQDVAISAQRVQIGFGVRLF